MTPELLLRLAELAEEVADYASADIPVWARMMTDASHIARLMADRELHDLEVARMHSLLDEIKQAMA